MPTIWIDADACPVPVREVVIKAAQRLLKSGTGINTVFVANASLPIKRSPNITLKVVSSGFDEADNYIVDTAQANDFIVTSDIPLAADAIAKGCVVVNSKGVPFSPETIRQKLNMRDFMESMRDTARMQGVQMKGSAPYSAKDKQQFANALNTWITKQT